MKPLELCVGVDGGLPALLHPGRAQAWWWTAAGPAWHDGERLWVRCGDRVLVIPMGGVPDVEPLPKGGLVAWTPQGAVVHVPRQGDPTRIHGPPDDAGAPTRVRNGADIRAVHVRGRGWRVQAEGTDVPLPEGATRAPDLRPFRRGEGVAWRSAGWLYRMAHRGTPRAMTELRTEDAFVTGPLGAVAVGDGDRWLRAAPPHGHLRVLPAPLLRTAWGLRWSPDGERLAGIDPDGRAVWVDLEAGVVAREQRDAFPLDTEGRWLGRDGTLSVGEDLGWTPREASWARKDDLLAGPGGVVWDLSTGHRCFARPVVRLGVTVAAEEAFATVAWETGEGRWFDPRTGATVDRFEVPVHPGDVLDSGWADGKAAVLSTAEGRQIVVEGGWFRFPTRPVRRPPDPPLDAGLAVDGDGLHTGGWRGTVWPVPVERAARVGERAFGWSTDGLLVAVPV